MEWVKLYHTNLLSPQYMWYWDKGCQGTEARATATNSRCKYDWLWWEVTQTRSKKWVRHCTTTDIYQASVIHNFPSNYSCQRTLSVDSFTLESCHQRHLKLLLFTFHHNRKRDWRQLQLPNIYIGRQTGFVIYLSRDHVHNNEDYRLVSLSLTRCYLRTSAS